MSALALAQRMDALGVRTLIHNRHRNRRDADGPEFSGAGSDARGGKILRDCERRSKPARRRRKARELSRRYANLDGVIVGKALYEKRVSLPNLLEVARASCP